MPDQQVVLWGDPIGAHGADVMSVNTKTGEVTLWDAKYRGDAVTLQPSSTFKVRSPSRQNAIDPASKAIRADTTLSPDVAEEAP